MSAGLIFLTLSDRPQICLLHAASNPLSTHARKSYFLIWCASDNHSRKSYVIFFLAGLHFWDENNLKFPSNYMSKSARTQVNIGKHGQTKFDVLWLVRTGHPTLLHKSTVVFVTVCSTSVRWSSEVWTGLNETKLVHIWVGGRCVEYQPGNELLHAAIGRFLMLSTSRVCVPLLNTFVVLKQFFVHIFVSFSNGHVNL